MIFRLIIIFLIVIFYNPIFNFFKNYNIDSLKNIKKTISKNTKNFVDNIVNHEFKDVLNTIKKVDKPTYLKCIKILKNIRRIKKDIENDKHIDFKNEFENLKLQRKEILNIIAAMIVNKGFFSSHSHILSVTEKYLKDTLLEIVDIAGQREYNNSWFEAKIDEVEPNEIYSPGFSPHYNIY